MGKGIKFILRLIFTPIGLLMIGLTALIEFMSSDPDWGYWRNHSLYIEGMLVFKMPWRY